VAWWASLDNWAAHTVVIYTAHEKHCRAVSVFSVTKQHMMRAAHDMRSTKNTDFSITDERLSKEQGSAHEARDADIDADLVW
jgi:hypothetical protein